MSQAETGSEFNLSFFRDNGFMRKKCQKCHKYFWTLDPGRKTCGDPPCDSYSFIGNPAGKGPMSIDDVRSSFFDYFHKDHTLVKPYPVVPRWRDDVLLVNASIYDFQPHVTSGIVKPPGNPLVMSQPSIRMNDLDSVGVSGRHLTSFEMLCHDSFNREGEEIYWKEGTLERCHGFYTRSMGIKPEEITYKENPWSGGGNAGNAMEVFVRGLEVATLVFMDMKENPEGEFEIEGNRYSKMEMRIVDTGYGLERMSWITTGAPTVYDSLYGDVIDHILKNSPHGILSRHMLGEITEIYSANPDELPLKIEADLREKGELSGNIDWEEVDIIRQAYILGDHARSIIHMFRDYVIPSNVKVGYLLRMLLRRSFRAIEKIQYNGNLMDILKLQEKHLANIVDGFPHEFAEKIIGMELEKYGKSGIRGQEEIDRVIKKKGSISMEDMMVLYDSYGMVPDAIQKAAQSRGLKIEIPHDFHKKVVEMHEKKEKEVDKKTPNSFSTYETRTLYYDDPSMMEFTAIVMDSQDNIIVTNQTAFYPTGGGQPYDYGYFSLGSKKFSVKDVYRQGKTIYHVLDGHLEKGSRIMGHVDMERRRQLMIHHTATHLLLGTLRAIFGDEVWQSGAQKNYDSSRIDVTISGKLDPEAIQNVEIQSMARILENRKVTVRNLEWNMAIGKYGFRLFEGGVPLSSTLRVVEIDGVDAEGCGGTHLSSTGEIGFIKIISSESIQEGIQRITFTAGPAALRYVQKIQKDLDAISNETRSTEDVVEKVRRNTSELLSLREEVSRLRKEKASVLLEKGKRMSRNGMDFVLVESSEEEGKEIIPLAMKEGMNCVIRTAEGITLAGVNAESNLKIYRAIYGSEPEKSGKVIRGSLKGINLKD